MQAIKFDPYGKEYQAMRLEALDRDHHRCCACNSTNSERRLEVHHRNKEAYRRPPKLEDLYTFCEECHDLWTNRDRKDREEARETLRAESRPLYDHNARPQTKEMEKVVAVDATRRETGRPVFARKEMTLRSEGNSDLNVRYKP